MLFVSKKWSANAARFDVFIKKQSEEGKVIGLSVILPCLYSLRLHAHRERFIAAMWKNTGLELAFARYHR